MNTTNNVPQAASLANLALNASNNVTGMGFNRPQPQPYVLPPPLPLTQQQQPPLPPQQQQQQQSQPYQQSMMQPPRPLSQPLQQHPSQQLNLQLPGLQRNMNNNNNNNNNIPQNDGANDIEFASTEKIDKHIADIIQSSTVTDQEEDITFTAFSSGRSLSLESLPDHVKQLMKDAKERAFKAGALKKRELKRIPQLDGEGTEEEDHKPIVNEDEINTSTTAATDDNPSIAITTTASTTPSAAGGTKADEKDDYDLGSDLDDTDEDDDDAEGNEEIEHIILCLYDKVTRTKNKWKCILKDGIMLVNGRDYLFHRANGDFEW
ncbi:transcription factor IIA, alpha/beta subunit [Mycotypha africana]|uniref:transcription factor IIA, alpha/beta subunit n=1 Tax=Mycotypha africana TaxID=64632 RepID=UPI002300E2B8|nr:transcription factor IIA, alpha/beta subunit [Mycotypha africana]KAI8988183.1 transcription factor IIA, alpha/beta subunit [Mycotypha africana]